MSGNRAGVVILVFIAGCAKPTANADQEADQVANCSTSYFPVAEAITQCLVQRYHWSGATAWRAVSKEMERRMPLAVRQPVMAPPHANTESSAAAPAALRPCGPDGADSAAARLPERTARVAQAATDRQDVEPVAHHTVLPGYRQQDDVQRDTAYLVGVFTHGPYNGYDLVLVTYRESPCKGEGCGEAHVRFAKKDHDLVYLRNLSWVRGLKLEASTFFPDLACHVSVDDHYTNGLYSYPPTVTGPGEGQTLEFVAEAVRVVDSTGLRKLFRDSALGNVYGSPKASDFHVFRPDGTMLKYHYYPAINRRGIRWGAETLSAKVEKHYTGYGSSASTGSYVATLEPCGGGPDIVTDVNPQQDLVVVGEVEGGGPILSYTNPNAAFLRTMFHEYNHPRYRDDDGRAPHDSITYAQFLASKPVFFWRDPFGQLERFVNGTYREPCMAEPVLYLYPQERRIVDVNVNANGHIVASLPPYHQRWRVQADPSGRLVDLRDHRRYKYLFWEGWSSLLQTPERGYVIEAGRVAQFFTSILPSLGLSRQEADDFTKAWLPRFKHAPWYFITFLPAEDIARLAPLRVTPQPTTVIRILMDYRPLDRPLAVRPPDLAPPPKRRGFTVVEWGGLTRQ